MTDVWVVLCDNPDYTGNVDVIGVYTNRQAADQAIYLISKEREISKWSFDVQRAELES